jgi:D-tyrosyl-tRNA(Tyr) deacylase
MIGFIQRVSKTRVKVEGSINGQVGRGLLVLVGLEKHDTHTSAQRLLEHILGYRVFPDESGRMNLSFTDLAGEVPPLPRFTLADDTRKGSRPRLSSDAAPELGESRFEYFMATPRVHRPKVAADVLGADMKVSLVNDGPETFWLQVGTGEKP